MFILITIVIIFALFLMATACRSGHKGLSALQGWSYAHRGLHGQSVPENSLEAFRRAVNAGYGIELDVHLLADGQLAVVHDSNLKRVTGFDVCIEDLCAKDLKNYYLEDSNQTIPLLSEVLTLCAGKIPLIVELKCVRNNYEALCAAACQMLDHYDGSYCIESFDPRCIFWLRKHRPDIIRGQLTENYFVSDGAALPFYLKFILRHQLLNFLIYPDFVAYRFSDRKTVSNFLVRKVWKAVGITWTIKNVDEYKCAVKEGWIPIFENFAP